MYIYIYVPDVPGGLKRLDAWVVDGLSLPQSPARGRWLVKGPWLPTPRARERESESDMIRYVCLHKRMCQCIYIYIYVYVFICICI